MGSAGEDVPIEEHSEDFEVIFEVVVSVLVLGLVVGRLYADLDEI